MSCSASGFVSTRYNHFNTITVMTDEKPTDDGIDAETEAEESIDEEAREFLQEKVNEAYTEAMSEYGVHPFDVGSYFHDFGELVKFEYERDKYLHDHSVEEIRERKQQMVEAHAQTLGDVESE